MDLSVPGAFAAMCRCGKKVADCTMKQRRVDEKRVVLPPSTEPLHYALDLALQIDAHTFDGTVKIKVDVKSAGLTSLTLNARELTVSRASFAGAGDATKIEFNEKKMTLTLTFAAALPAGVGELVIAFAGALNNQMCGFYRSTYEDINGEKKLMASTQFESIDARRCFPCWDEPARKATFTCSLRVPRHMTALSNMPEALCRDHGDGTKTVAFMESPRMSTYLLCFVVGTSSSLLIRRRYEFVPSSTASANHLVRVSRVRRHTMAVPRPSLCIRHRILLTGVRRTLPLVLSLSTDLSQASSTTSRRSRRTACSSARSRRPASPSSASSRCAAPCSRSTSTTRRSRSRTRCQSRTWSRSPSLPPARWRTGASSRASSSSFAAAAAAAVAPWRRRGARVVGPRPRLTCMCACRCGCAWRPPCSSRVTTCVRVGVASRFLALFVLSRYREVDMLVDEATASSRQLQRVAEVRVSRRTRTHAHAHTWPLTPRSLTRAALRATTRNDERARGEKSAERMRDDVEWMDGRGGMRARRG